MDSIIITTPYDKEDNAQEKQTGKSGKTAFMALQGHPRYGESLKIHRRYDRLGENYCVAEYEAEPEKRYYLPEKWLLPIPPSATPKPTDNTIVFSMRALHKMVQLIDSQNQRWRVRNSDKGKEDNKPADLGASAQAEENTTEPLSVFPDPQGGRRNKQ